MSFSISQVDPCRRNSLSSASDDWVVVNPKPPDPQRLNTLPFKLLQLIFDKLDFLSQARARRVSCIFCIILSNPEQLNTALKSRKVASQAIRAFLCYDVCGNVPLHSWPKLDLALCSKEEKELFGQYIYERMEKEFRHSIERTRSVEGGIRYFRSLSTEQKSLIPKLRCCGYFFQDRAIMQEISSQCPNIKTLILHRLNPEVLEGLQIGYVSIIESLTIGGSDAHSCYDKNFNDRSLATILQNLARLKSLSLYNLFYFQGYSLSCIHPLARLERLRFEDLPRVKYEYVQEFLKQCSFLKSFWFVNVENLENYFKKYPGSSDLLRLSVPSSAPIRQALYPLWCAWMNEALLNRLNQEAFKAEY